MPKKKKKPAQKRTRTKKGPPVICGCPAGTRTSVRSGALICRTPAGDVRSATCSVSERKYRIGPPRTSTGATTGKAEGLVLEAPEFNYSTTSEPCSSKRKGCPVQLVARGGKQYLRFCLKAGNGRPGHLVAIADPTAARKLAAEACAQWSAQRRRFTSTNPAVIEARGALGRLPRRA